MMKLVIFAMAVIVLSGCVSGENVVHYDVGLENCPCITTYELKPLCASNGISYSNNGMFECAKKCLKKELASELTKVHDGGCE